MEWCRRGHRDRPCGPRPHRIREDLCRDGHRPIHRLPAAVLVLHLPCRSCQVTVESLVVGHQQGMAGVKCLGQSAWLCCSLPGSSCIRSGRPEASDRLCEQVAATQCALTVASRRRGSLDLAADRTRIVSCGRRCSLRVVVAKIVASESDWVLAVGQLRKRWSGLARRLGASSTGPSPDGLICVPWRTPVGSFMYRRDCL